MNRALFALLLAASVMVAAQAPQPKPAEPKTATETKADKKADKKAKKAEEKAKKAEEKKKAAEAKKKQKQIVVKEIKLRPKIEEHDFQVKKRHIEEFLSEGDKVKITVRFRGREIVHPEMAQKLLQRIATEVVSKGKIERAPSMEARTMVMLLTPIKK